MDIFYLIDVSGSMNYNGGIQSVNKAMPEIVEILRSISEQNHDQGEIYLSCITFGDEAHQLYPRPVAVEDFMWAPLKARGLTNLADAFHLLEKQMHRNTGMSSAEGHLRPAVFLLTDGDPDEGWQRELENLQKNRWFREAYKIAIAINPNSTNHNMKKALSHFSDPLDAGGQPLIIRVTELSKLYEVIRRVSTTVSTLGSRCSGGAGSVSDAISRAVRTEIDPISGVDVPAIGIDNEWWN